MIAHLKGRDRALEPFGLSGRRAEWIALASLHGGVFTRAQLSDWLGASRFKVLRLVQALKDQRLLAEETVGGLKVCRVCARGIYRALGAEDVRFQRITSTEVVVRRLLSFDYVIEHPGLPWLATESEKVAAARREAARIEGAILGMDDEAVAEMGGFQACLRRVAEMRELLLSARPGGTIDAHSVWRSSRLSGIQI